MREILDVTHECPHCGQEVDVNAARADETVKVTCCRCGRLAPLRLHYTGSGGISKFGRFR